ncbi:hypothetical protein CDAR_243671 [Caerostris darwini]|uniref:Uncharacterized protein n=1 Tax=Caerostris darwini TaxID=1538125 RepID=A0AAV4VEI8_9ARAC|nr:hypothetical protein CDAR_243671 [Caerostris darwini]
MTKASSFTQSDPCASSRSDRNHGLPSQLSTPRRRAPPQLRRSEAEEVPAEERRPGARRRAQALLDPVVVVVRLLRAPSRQLDMCYDLQLFVPQGE